MENLEKQFSKIYDQYIDKIYRFIFLKVNSQEIAEDLTSETFLRAWQAFKKGEIENVRAFLYKIARNLVTDFYREKGKVKIISADSLPLIDPKQNLEEKYQIDSDLNEIRMALANLKEDYQNALIWYYLENLPLSEVANLLEKSKENTRVLIHRALKALKEELNKCNKKGENSSS